MNPPSSRSGPFQQHHGCEGDGCASAVDTWPLHHVYCRGVRRRLCSSCILLFHRSYYCCSCFFLTPLAAQWSLYEDGDPLVDPPAPIHTCHVCHEAVAHLACLPRADGVFICPACSAAAEGRPFTYAPRSGTPLDDRAARVLVVGARLALLLLQRSANMARAEAERLARHAVALRRRARHALAESQDVDTEAPSWNINAEPDPPSTSENRLEKEVGEGSGTSVNAPLVQRERYAMPPLSALTIGTGRVRQWAMAATEAAKDRDRDSLRPPPATPLLSIPAAATAAAEASAPAPPTLQLFPASVKTSSRRTRARTLQLFKDKMPDDGGM